jgi:flagellar hook-associated protein FlgK
MTEARADAPQETPEGTTETSQRQLPSATEALEELHGLLAEAGRGNVDPTEVRAALKSYWRNHQDTLRNAASTLAEQVRLQTLQELYKWRAQLASQLQTQSSAHEAQRGRDATS